MFRSLTKRLITPSNAKSLELMQLAKYSDYGNGADKGGGGAIRQAGGGFARMEAGREEQFFKRKQKEQLRVLKNVFDGKAESKPAAAAEAQGKK